MLLKTIPLSACLSAKPIDSLEPLPKTRKPMRNFDRNVAMCKKDLRDCGRCTCQRLDEIEEIRKMYPQIEVDDVIINGEKYYGMWEVTLDIKYRR